MQLEDLQYITIDGDEIVSDKSGYRNFSKDIALTIGYLLGVREDFLEKIVENPEEYYNLKETIEKNDSAKAIRILNNIRSNLMLMFKKVSRTIRIGASNYTPLYNMDEFKDDFRALRRLDIDISTGRSDINEYLIKINNEITKHIDKVERLFPEWVEFKHVKYMFSMPTTNIKAESEKFQNNQNCYPYKRYFNWKDPEEMGNILVTDAKILELIYQNNGKYFQDYSKVMDASDDLKNSINEFINRGKKIQIYIDGENVDPYRFASAIEGLKDHEIEKIDKIVVYYDNKFSSKAWNMLHHFTCGIEVEPVGVDRIIEEKSLVDHKLVAGVSKAVYRDEVDSIIIASSDSDFWSVIEDVEAKYLVMVESEKCAHNFKDVLREHDVFYCYLDKFMTPEDNLFFKTVFRKELEGLINKSFELGNAKDLFNDAIFMSRADVSESEQDALYNKYIKGLKLEIDKDDNLKLVIPE